MTIWQFMSDSPILTFLLAYMLLHSIGTIILAYIRRNAPVVAADDEEDDE